MPRYFLETSYKGTAYSGFQIQGNAVTVQSEIEKALAVLFRQPFSLTGSSRTDAGVHARQNFFHFDWDEARSPCPGEEGFQQAIYHLNAILPADIVVKSIRMVDKEAHCRFDAVSREYRYYIYHTKNPFVADRAFFYPYALQTGLLHQAAAIVQKHTDFTCFAKKNTQAHTFLCKIETSEWYRQDDMLVYRVKANRFLRGMVKGLVGTMLRVGTGKISPEQFEDIFFRRQASPADFSVPSHGLFLIAVNY